MVERGAYAYVFVCAYESSFIELTVATSSQLSSILCNGIKETLGIPYAH